MKIYELIIEDADNESRSVFFTSKAKARELQDSLLGSSEPVDLQTAEILTHTIKPCAKDIVHLLNILTD